MRARRGRTRSSGLAYDARTGFKTDGRKLRADYYTGLYTTDPDDQHPQDFPVVPGPDGRAWMPGLPSTDAVGAKHTWKDTSWPSNAPTPRMAFWINKCPASSGVNVGVAPPELTLNTPTAVPGLGLYFDPDTPAMELSLPTAVPSSGVSVGATPPSLALAAPAVGVMDGIGFTLDAPDLTLSAPGATASSGTSLSPTAPTGLELSDPVAAPDPIAENWGADNWGSQTWGGV